MGPVSKHIRTSLTVAVVVAVACSPSDERTEQVVAGMSRDSALAMLASPIGEVTAAPDSAPGDSLKNIWRRTMYLIEGQSIEVLWYSQTGEKRTATDTIPEGRVIPVVVIDGKVVGVGRSAYDRVAERYKLPRNRY